MVEICTQVNVIPLSMYLRCHNVASDKAASVMPKNIEIGIINPLLVKGSIWTPSNLLFLILNLHRLP